MNITINQTITLDDIKALLYDDATLVLSEEAKERITKSYEFLKTFSTEKVIYGINTGFGPMAQYRVDDRFLKELQYNIIRSHSTGAGEPLCDEYVKSAMIARLGTLIQGYSGIHLSVAELIVEFINRGIYPKIPCHGSVGASGDLVQLAHIALALIGEGEVHYNKVWRSTAEVLKENNLQPIQMYVREGLCITNGTSVMSGIAAVNLIYCRNIMHFSIMASSMINEIASSYDDFMSKELNGARLHEGQQIVAEKMKEILKDSHCVLNRETALYDGGHSEEKTFHHKVQPYYSLRCVPQVLGPIYEEIQHAIDVTEKEFSSACDNPIVDYRTNNVYHGGNFHGDYISYEMDKLKTGITKLTMLAERQLNYLCHDRINEILPPFVNMGTLGLNYGVQACQFTATSTTAECQTLSMPNSIHSIPNNNDNQDIVSMGTNSALLAGKVIENSFQVLAIHFITIIQAVDCLKIQNAMSSATRKLYEDLRNIVPLFVEDTPKYEEIEKVIEYLKTNKQ